MKLFAFRQRLAASLRRLANRLDPQRNYHLTVY